jgi:ankyrin repeat protein
LGNDGHTPLLAAARDGKEEITRMLLAAGADPYLGDYLQVWQGHVDVAEVLEMGGADVTLRALTEKPPVDIAVETYGEAHPITVLVRFRLPSQD